MGFILDGWLELTKQHIIILTGIHKLAVGDYFTLDTSSSGIYYSYHCHGLA